VYAITRRYVMAVAHDPEHAHAAIRSCHRLAVQVMARDRARGLPKVTVRTVCGRL
jgi:hypothetical protein